MTQKSVPKIILREARRLLNLEPEGENLPYSSVRGLLLFLITGGLILLVIPRERGLGITAYTRGPGRPTYGKKEKTEHTWHGNSYMRMRLRQRIARLQRQGIIELATTETEKMKVRLTAKGKKYIEQHVLQNLESFLQKQDVWDGVWRLIIFDIPESKRIARDALRQTLERLGFHRLQKSVFIYPYPCFSEIIPLLDYFEVRPFVTVTEAKNLGWHEKMARKMFNL